MGKRYDAKEMNDFIDMLGDDIDDYRESARLLENEYGNYYNNDTHRGLAAEASKDFIARAQMDNFHRPNLKLQTLLFSKCVEIERDFRHVVDASGEARIDTDVLKMIDDNFCKWGDGIHASGSVIEQLATEVVSKFGKYATEEFANVHVGYGEVRAAYAYLCGPDGHLVDCIKKMNCFDETSLSALRSCSIKEQAYDLQSMMQKTANALSMMQAYAPKLSKTSLSIVSMWSAAASGKALNIKTFATEEEAANYLDQQFRILCDDNNANDKDAMANINACLMGYLCVETSGKDKYVAYDKDKIENTLAYLEKDGLAYQLFDSIDKQIYENQSKGDAVPNAITKLGLGGKLENTHLEVKKDGAGVRLEVTSNNDWLPGKEIKNQPVAYACTEESAENYFMTDGKYDWDAINEWIKKNAIDNTSIEYAVFGQKMIDMSDDEIETLLNNGMFSNTKGVSKVFSDYCGATTYSEGENLQIAAQRYAAMMNIARNSDNYDSLTLEQQILIDNNETRSIAVLEATKKMAKNGGMNMYVDLSTENKSGGNAYIIEIKAIPNNSQSESQALANMADSYLKDSKIVVYPRASEKVIDKYSHEQTTIVLQSYIKPIYSHEFSDSDYEKVAIQMVKILAKEGGKVAGETASGVVSIALKGVDIALKGKALAEDYKKSAEATTAIEALNTGSNAMSMCVEGTVIYTTGNTSGSVQIYGLEYDENELRLRNAAYNIANGQNMTVDQLKEHYINGDADFQNYSDWYYSPHTAEQCANYKNALRKMVETKYSCKLEDATDDQINDASQQLSAIINDTRTNELLNKDYTVIEKAIEESVG